MKVGSLIEFRNCAYTGKTGIITRLTQPTEIAKTDPALRIYWVFSGGSECCYTGNQLVLLA